MARVNGPLMSVDASGKIYNAMVFSIWKGRNYVRGYVVPTTSQLPQCIAARTAFGAAVADWQADYPGTKAAWNLAAQEVYPPISGFNYFVMQWILQTEYPSIPAIAPSKSKVIHGR